MSPIVNVLVGWPVLSVLVAAAWAAIRTRERALLAEEALAAERTLSGREPGGAWVAPTPAPAPPSRRAGRP